jgi:hypothetical protein
MTTTTSIKLDDGLKARLQQMALARRRSVHWLMREAIAEYVAREDGLSVDAPDIALAPGPKPTAPDEDAYAWLAQLEAKGVNVKPPRRRS